MNNSIDINIVNLKSIAHNSADFTVRELNLNDKYNWSIVPELNLSAAAKTKEGTVDGTVLTDSALSSLTNEE